MTLHFMLAGLWKKALNGFICMWGQAEPLTQNQVRRKNEKLKKQAGTRIRKKALNGFLLALRIGRFGGEEAWKSKKSH